MKIILLAIILLLFLIYTLTSENFWGGYFPTPYVGQPVQRYGRTGVDAATDDPRFFTDCNAYPING